MAAPEAEFGKRTNVVAALRRRAAAMNLLETTASHTVRPIAD
jgi:hypothetical protein